LLLPAHALDRLHIGIAQGRQFLLQRRSHVRPLGTALEQLFPGFGVGRAGRVDLLDQLTLLAGRELVLELAADIGDLPGRLLHLRLPATEVLRIRVEQRPLGPDPVQRHRGMPLLGQLELGVAAGSQGLGRRRQLVQAPDPAERSDDQQQQDGPQRKGKTRAYFQLIHRRGCFRLRRMRDIVRRNAAAVDCRRPGVWTMRGGVGDTWLPTRMQRHSSMAS